MSFFLLLWRPSINAPALLSSQGVTEVLLFFLYLVLVDWASYSLQMGHRNAFTSLNAFSCQVYTIAQRIKAENEKGHVIIYFSLAGLHSSGILLFLSSTIFGGFESDSGEPCLLVLSCCCVTLKPGVHLRNRSGFFSYQDTFMSNKEEQRQLSQARLF